MFFATVPLAAAAFALARGLPNDRAHAAGPRERFDVGGTALLAATLTAFALATTWHGAPGWRLGFVAMTLAGVATFVAIERRAAAPLIPPPLLRRPGLTGALFANTVVSAVMMATLVVGPFHLVQALGLDPGGAGLAMSLGPLVSAIVGIPAGRLVDRIGARRVAMAGLLGVAVGTALLAGLAAWPTVPAYVVPLAVTTASYALFAAANNTAVMEHADPSRRGVLSGLLSLSRNLGLMTGATLLGAVFAAACTAGDVAGARPEEIAEASRITFGLASLAVALTTALALRSARRDALDRKVVLASPSPTGDPGLTQR